MDKVYLKHTLTFIIVFLRFSLCDAVLKLLIITLIQLTVRRHTSYEYCHEQISNQKRYRDHVMSDKQTPRAIKSPTNKLHVLCATIELFDIIIEQLYGRSYNPSGVRSIAQV